MADSRSLMEYVAQRFEDTIFDAIADYITEVDFDNLGLHISCLHEIGEYCLSEVYVKNISVYDQPEMRIGIDLGVEVYIEVKEGDHHYGESERPSQWFLLQLHLSKNSLAS